MDGVFRWLEASAFSVFLRESTSVFVYPAMLSAHAIGMGLAVGISFVLAVRVLGLVPGIPPAELRHLSPVFWGGFVLNATSGVLLLVAYPTKALTNPVFYVKLAAVVAGAWSYRTLQRGADEGDHVRWLAILSLLSWVVAIAAGRLLAYTYHRLFVDF